jgi:hypothetical protein
MLSEVKGLSHETRKVEKTEYRRSSDERAYFRLLLCTSKMIFDILEGCIVKIIKVKNLEHSLYTSKLKAK